MSKDRHYKIALAFGCGKESSDLLEQLKDQSPLLITCLSKNSDVDGRVVKWVADYFHCDYLIIPSSFTESWDIWSDGQIRQYKNIILKWCKKHGYSFDRLIIGRLKRDLWERNLYPKRLVEKIQINQLPSMVYMPYWDL